jgi:hypothetical protein
LIAAHLPQLLATQPLKCANGNTFISREKNKEKLTQRQTGGACLKNPDNFSSSPKTAHPRF